MDLNEVQEAFRNKYAARDEARGPFATLAWLVEEIGEVAEALLSGDRDALREEIADVLAWTISLAAMLGIDIEEALCGKYGDVLSDQCTR